MPQQTFNITDGSKDAFVRKYQSVGQYPPNTTTNYDGTDNAVYVARELTGSGYEVYNGLLQFDTSGLPNDATVTGATLKIWVSTAIGRSSVDALSLVAEWYTPTFSASDYTATAASTAHTGTLISSLVLDAYSTLALTDAAGYSNISKTGNTGLRLHVSQRAADAAPSGINYLGFLTVEGAGGGPYAPQLVVTYTSAPLTDYAPTEYVDNVTAITAARLNNEEVQVDRLTDVVLALASSSTASTLTLSDLRAAPAPTANSTTLLLGHTTPGDGGDGTFIYDTTAAKSFSATATDDYFASTAHGFKTGTPVRLYGTIPSPLSASTTYYVRLLGLDPNYFKLVATGLEAYRTYEPWSVPIDVPSNFSGTVQRADDGGVTIAPTGQPAVGRWRRLEKADTFNAKWFGAKGDKVADDTAALNTACLAAAEYGAPLYIPPGEYKTSDMVAHPGEAPCIEGSSAYTTAIVPTTGDVDALRVGPNDGNGGYAPRGYLRNLSVQNTTNGNYTSFTAAIKIDSLPMFELTNCFARGFHIGFDMVNNCGGTIMSTCRSQFGDNGIGLYIRNGPQSGSDIFFNNNWLHGFDAGVWIERWGGGYHFNGGQLSAGFFYATNQDDLGALVLGPQYENRANTGPVPNVELNGVSFEGMHRVWCIRAHDEIAIDVNSCNFNGTSSPYPLGVMKVTNGGQYQIAMRSCHVGGSYQNANPLSISTANVSNWLFYEQGTRVDAGGAMPFFNGVQLNVRNGLINSGGTVLGGVYDVGT